GVCLVLGGAGVAVVQPAGGKQISLETSTAPAADSPATDPTAPSTAAPTTDAPAPAAAAPTTRAPATTAPKRTTTTGRQSAAAAPQVVAPGVAFTAPALPSSPHTPASSPVPPTAAGDSISTAPLLPGTTTTTSAGTGRFAFLDTWGNGKPARWNPCTPIHYAVNTSGAPAGALALVQQAVARLASATGATFVFDGTTSEVPTSSWGFGPSSSFPSGWQPLLIGFPTPGESDLVDGENAGAAFPVTLEFTATGELVDVSGAVAVDGELAAILPMTFGGASVGSILLHELAHALGLGHVDDRAEIMNPVVGAWTPSTWGSGDSEGLRQLGTASGCTRAVPAAPWG
ncbi:MAG: hypothetical protein QOG87_4173, partial [Actinomycetota bacterium]